MHLALIGANYRSSSLNIRECMAIAPEKLAGALERLRRIDGVEECLLLSTCNRTEAVVFFATGELEPDRIIAYLAQESGLDEATLRPALYGHVNEAAVAHLFEVASGLDSMVLGETQILGQVKTAYSAAVAAGATGPRLNRLMHIAFRVAKRIRTETDIGKGTLSVSQAACDLAAKIFSDLRARAVLLIGAGEVAELAAQILRERGVARLTIANRTRERAEALAAQLGGASIAPFEKLLDAVAQADIVIASVGAPEPILRTADLRPLVARRRSPLFMIDLAVPRNIEPSANDLEGVFVYDIDELGRQVEANQARREAERARCRAMIEAGTAAFREWSAHFKVSPTIKELQQQLEGLRAAEIERLRDNLEPAQYVLVEDATRRLMTKILAHPILHVKDAAKSEDAGKVIAFIRDILGLHGDER
jgi:glutamyl-tRNA reductase